MLLEKSSPYPEVLKNVQEILGNNVNDLINSKNYTLSKIAQKLNYNRAGLSQLTGCGSNHSNCQLKTIVNIARFFNISVFLLVSRLYKDELYRNHFTFVEENYSKIFRDNLIELDISPRLVHLDPTTVSHILHGRRTNFTLATMCEFSRASSTPLYQLLMTDIDKQIITELNEKEDYL